MTTRGMRCVRYKHTGAGRRCASYSGGRHHRRHVGYRRRHHR